MIFDAAKSSTGAQYIETVMPDPNKQIMAYVYIHTSSGRGITMVNYVYTRSPSSPDFCIDELSEWDSVVCMIRPNFLTTADRLELLSCVKCQREDHGVARRANALLLLDTGMSCSQIEKVLFLDDDTVRSWHK